MGSLKLFNGGQAVMENFFFTRFNMNDSTPSANFSLSVYPTATYTNADLSTVSSGYIYPFFSPSASASGYLWQHFSLYNPSGYTYCKMYGSTDDTHDKTLDTFHNKVASVSFTGEGVFNGVKSMSISLTNLDADNAVTVKSIQKSSYSLFNKTANTNSNSYAFYLDWAYYLDSSEYITLAAGETKSITLSVSIADLTA